MIPMLTSDTKQKIQNLRDTLVGKIPVPTEQVKQITLGLIYKFMSDIDQENKELGGKSFFNGDYKKYAWQHIMDRALSSYDRVLLYSEGLEKMALNPNIPQLFRDIFKGAFLPFRDPGIVNEFLKGINDFNYEHSEDLGDAFEFLLMVMDAQGDAGQFRTPRHIIDFIVQTVDPQKTDKILDPACGTAGFLIGAYKHILRQNTAPKSDRPGSALTTTQRNNLSKNFVGYDVSHDMVRLSMVNMYLHQFSDPKIYEYDTLTSQDHWEDNFDCILANPPFMTPRGGIRPHNRFAIRANRSEVLFVDYILEHLNPSGKAGIIVPEGIIFQSANAYKALRKMLVDGGYLYAVVSLPAGIFQPYSGVKTSILLIDKTLAKKTKDILFVKIKNDGFDLGAQRRTIEIDDLPMALAAIQGYKQSLAEARTFESNIDNKIIHIVEKKVISKKSDYDLSADRYMASAIRNNQQLSFYKLGDLIVETTERAANEKYEVWSVANTLGFVPSAEYFEKEVASKDTKNYKIVKPRSFAYNPSRINVGSIALNSGDNIGIVSPMYVVFRINDESIIKAEFLLYILKSVIGLQIILKNSRGAVRQQLRFKDLAEISIPLPSVEVQKEVVAELDSYQKVINGARQVVENWKPKIDVDSKWDEVALGDITKIITKGTTPTTNGFRFEEKGISFIKIEAISETGRIDPNKLSFISQTCHDSFKRSQLELNDILFSIAGTEMGISALVTQDILPANTNQALAIIRLQDHISPQYVLNCLRSVDIKLEIENIKVGVAQFNLSLKQVSEIKIPLPPLEIQKQIVAQIEEEQKLVEANKKLIELFEQKIKDKIKEVWGE